MAPGDARPETSRIAALPKVVLHDHLDGGVRPLTLIELSRRSPGLALPGEDPDSLVTAIGERARRGGLAGYLSVFDHTLAVMQDPDALERIAAEAVEDLAADGVVAAEIRFAPELHTRHGLDLDTVVAAVLRGVAGVRARPEVGVILSAMRTGDRSEEIARLAGRWRDRGVVGFDLAGDEHDHPVAAHREAFAVARAAGVHLTAHAGEVEGITEIADALDIARVERLGHGLRVIDEVTGPGGSTDCESWGSTARRVRRDRIPLEMCPHSNVDTGVVADLASHPLDDLHRRGFAVTVNTDNRLISRTSLTAEFEGLVTTFAWTLDDIETVTLTALRASFLDPEVRHRVEREIVTPGFARVRAASLSEDPAG